MVYNYGGDTLSNAMANPMAAPLENQARQQAIQQNQLMMPYNIQKMQAETQTAQTNNQLNLMKAPYEIQNTQLDMMQKKMTMAKQLVASAMTAQQWNQNKQYAKSLGLTIDNIPDANSDADVPELKKAAWNSLLTAEQAVNAHISQQNADTNAAYKDILGQNKTDTTIGMTDPDRLNAMTAMQRVQSGRPLPGDAQLIQNYQNKQSGASAPAATPTTIDNPISARSFASVMQDQGQQVPTPPPDMGQPLTDEAASHLPPAVAAGPALMAPGYPTQNGMVPTAPMQRLAFNREGGTQMAVVRNIQSANPGMDTNTAIQVAHGHMPAGTVLDKTGKLVPMPGAEDTTQKMANAAATGTQNAEVAAAEPKEAQKDTVEKSNALAADASQAQNFLFTAKTIEDAMQNVQSGALAPARMQLQRAARAVGYPLTTAEVSQLSSAQDISKLTMNILGAAAKQEGQASRLNAAFQALKSANPNLGTEPETIHDILQYMGGISNKVVTEQNSWIDARKQNPALAFSDFEGSYISNLSKQQQESGGKLGGYDFKMGGNGPPNGKLIGHSGGKAVYQLPDGRTVMEQ